MSVSVPTSAQVAFNGNYDLKWMIMKARVDLARSMQSPTRFYEDAMNFSVSIASMADWAWKLEVRHAAAWQEKTQREFVMAVGVQAPAVLAFTDLANEFKHADRTQTNFVARNLLIFSYDPTDASVVTPELLAKSIVQPSSGGTRYVPAVIVDAGRPYYIDVANSALAWWDAFDSSTFVP